MTDTDTDTDSNSNGNSDDDQITVTTDPEALAMVLERASIEIDELYEMGEEDFADEACAAYEQVKADFEAARENS
jgi:hypothetical protein